jgi:pimeloyl-ACP methyl ester carboxylesterase
LEETARHVSQANAPEPAMIGSSTGLPELTVHGIRCGVRIAARTRGDGPTVLLLHGVGTASASFWAQFDGLSATHELIAWDAPGYGASTDPRIPVRLDDYADAAVDLLDALGRRDAHVVGVSWGGVIATRLALRHPDRVRTLALVDSTYGRKHNAALRERFHERVALLERDGGRLGPPRRLRGGDRDAGRHRSP